MKFLTMQLITCWPSTPFNTFNIVKSISLQMVQDINIRINVEHFTEHFIVSNFVI